MVRGVMKELETTEQQQKKLQRGLAAPHVDGRAAVLTWGFEK